MIEYKTEAGDPTCTLCDKLVTGRCIYWQNGWPLHEKCFEKVQHIIKLNTDYMRWLHTESLPPGTHFTPLVDSSLSATVDRNCIGIVEQLNGIATQLERILECMRKKTP